MSYRWVGRVAGIAAAFPLSYYLFSSSVTRATASLAADLETPTRRRYEKPFELVQTLNEKRIPSTVFLSEGSWNVLYFGFTHCAEVCPNSIRYIDKVFSQLRQNYKTAGRTEAFPQIRCAFVSLDPYRDTARKMEGFLDAFASKENRSLFDGYLGSIEDIKNVSRAWKVYFAAPEEEEVTDNSEFQIDHSCFIFLVSPTGHLVDFFTKDMPLEMSAEKIQLHFDGLYE